MMNRAGFLAILEMSNYVADWFGSSALDIDHQPLARARPSLTHFR